ncbi:uncharacterized protein N7483_012133 [Penicillium malachiteum]|uniref:uncharacterized protein n=1 Tax=Penicillium malachiteum TaxID=1324776 RepID=UPI002548A734|nr:uncharacterized protein N7483_012133 [Penicillium malachiteum]KAJ5714952.1 hypothetical protein N7483_012133 [Penicillium malachiteum]
MTSQPDFQSRRSSCERCRFHKLRCTVVSDSSDGSPRCVRCMRAKVDCVFGRRARGKRNRSQKDHTQINWGLQSPVTDSISTDGKDTIFNDTPRSINHQPCIFPSPSPPYIDGSDIRSEDMDWDLLFHPDQGLGHFIPSSQPSPYNLWDVAFSQTALDSSLSTIPQGSWKSNIPPPTPCKEKGPDIILRLSSLATDIQQTIINLQDSEWAYATKSDGLERYPVGSVLQLAHDFSLILQDLPQSANNKLPTKDHQDETSSIPDLSSDPTHLSDPTSNSTKPTQQSTLPHVAGTSNSIDTSTMLQITSCYILITKLYGLVMDHLRAHLQASDLQSTKVSPFSSIENEALRLGDISYSNDVWTKVHTVFRAMLDQLHVIGSAIGVESFRSSRSLGLDEAVSHSGFLGNLSQAALEDNLMGKVQPLKLLLRQKLAL